MEASERFKRDFMLAKEVYPDLVFTLNPTKEYCYKISGTFKIIDENGHQWGAFLVSINFMNTYPKGFPLLTDESRVFPWKLDWHMNPANGDCCVCSPIESIEFGHKGITILDFIQKYTIPFYANQIYKQEYGAYKNGEYSHFGEGVWETLEEEFNTRDRDVIKQLLSLMRIKRGRNEKCFCGSGEKYKMCHLNRIKYIKELQNFIL